MKKGTFITLEGGEGTGKTTQMEFVEKWFKDHNIPYILVHEPGGTALGEEIRKILKYGHFEIKPRAELLLFNAVRAELIDEVIKPALNNGINVICDRFYDSSIAYQGFGRGLDTAQVKEICMYATSHLKPDMTLWFDLDPMQAFKRKHGGDADDRIETISLDFHNKVYEGYKHLYKHHGRIRRIDASKPIEEVSEQIAKYLKEKFL